VYAICPIHLILPDSITITVHIKNNILLTSSWCNVYCSLVIRVFGSRYSSQHFILRPPQSLFYLTARNQVSHQNKTTDKSTHRQEQKIFSSIRYGCIAASCATLVWQGSLSSTTLQLANNSGPL
jgi:hypothetical protein